MKHTFQDRENVMPFVEEGDYIVIVDDLTEEISRGGKTSGCDMVKLKLQVQGNGNFIYERLVDHESCGWKIDTFLKSIDAAPSKGQPAEIDERLIGRRGWVRLTVTEYQGRPRNEIAVWYTDREKLEPEKITRQDDPFAPDESDPFYQNTTTPATGVDQASDEWGGEDF